MGFDQIIALDLGKFKSVACVMDARTRKHTFATVDTTPAALHDLLAVHTGAVHTGAAHTGAVHTGVEASRVVVVLEACDCAGWVHDLAAALGLDVRVANCCHESWRWRRVKRKTDRDDALRLARMVLLDQLPVVHVPASRQRQRRQLVLHRRSVVQRRTACKNAIRAVFSQQGLAPSLIVPPWLAWRLRPRGRGA